MNTEVLNIILTKFKEDKLTLEETSKLIDGLSTNINYYPYYPYYTTYPSIPFTDPNKFEITCKNENN